MWTVSNTLRSRAAAWRAKGIDDRALEDYGRALAVQGDLPWAYYNRGLILREKWTAQPGLFERLAREWRLAIFTGRTKDEARVTLDRCAPHLTFDPIIGNTDVENLKPAPDGILKILKLCSGMDAIYLGDNIDDGRSAHAARVPFIGVVAAENTRRTELTELFLCEGARAVISSVNEIEEVLG